MKSKVITGVMLFFLVINMSTLAFNIQPAEAEPTTWTVDDDLQNYPGDVSLEKTKITLTFPPLAEISSK